MEPDISILSCILSCMRQYATSYFKEMIMQTKVLGVIYNDLLFQYTDVILDNRLLLLNCKKSCLCYISLSQVFEGHIWGITAKIKCVDCIKFSLPNFGLSIDPKIEYQSSFTNKCVYADAASNRNCENKLLKPQKQTPWNPLIIAFWLIKTAFMVFCNIMLKLS